jgi:hypothetical protein
MKEYKKECAGARVSRNKSGNNCSGLRSHRNTWKGALGLGMSGNGSGNIYSSLQRHKMQRNTRRSMQGLGCPETSPEIIVPDSGGTGIRGKVYKD